MTSAALDATLCLVLLSAAATTLVAVPGADRPAEGGTADATAEVLATSTTNVRYTLAPGARRADERLVPFPETDGPEFDRTAHGTYAELLADAAVERPTVRGERLTRTGDDFARKVRRAVRNATGPRAHVVAVWRPYPGSHLQGRLAVGEAPPAGAAVHAATLAAPSGLPAARSDAIAAAERGGFGAVAGVVADRIVGGLFPPERTRFALRDDYPLPELVTYRYLRTAALYGADAGDVENAARRDRTGAANDRLAEALSTAIERDLRRRFETPRAAARTVDVRSVRITVRTWSP
ncbi:DUF7284 family protein [Halegenticoccus soli]|uniref:DUF7284 family protein n=1 Tax=Halegenticoccus soli TaxID=1985678 RepID=UPI000C6EC8E1|nr:hypothetical protein [Halegenticoccus soli]